MKTLMKTASALLRDSDIKKVELVKDGDSKVEIWHNGQYAGRWLVNYSEEIKDDKEKLIEGLHRYWASVHGEGYSNPHMIKWIEENM